MVARKSQSNSSIHWCAEMPGGQESLVKERGQQNIFRKLKWLQSIKTKSNTSSIYMLLYKSRRKLFVAYFKILFS